MSANAQDKYGKTGERRRKPQDLRRGLALFAALCLVVALFPLPGFRAAADDGGFGSGAGDENATGGAIEVSITETDATTAGAITGFAPLPDSFRFQRGGEPVLPETLEGVADGETLEIPVTWTAEDYARGNTGLYVFIAAPAEGYTVAAGVEAPRIAAMITEAAGAMRMMRAFGRVDGLGTAGSPLILTNADQLAEIATLVNAGELEGFVFGSNTDNNQIHLKLGGDIDLSGYGVGYNDGKGWVPIGTPSNPFRGVFDGAGYAIRGLYLNDANLSYAGLFGCVYYASALNLFPRIENLGLEDAYVRGYIYVGGVVGYVTNSIYYAGYRYYTLTNCHTTGTVMGFHLVGGMVGKLSGNMKDCYATGAVTGANQYIGGVVGELSGNMENCYATGAVTGAVTSAGTGMRRSVGGVVGEIYNGSVENCHATGAVTGGQYVGGVVGRSDDDVRNCYATGAVTGGDYVGGVAGWVHIHCTIENSHATGAVIGKSTNGSVGGVAGYVCGGGNLKNCYATGAVTGPVYVGGVVGRITEQNYTNFVAVENCYATGAVTGSGFNGGIGGVVGYIDNTNGSVKNCYATGAVTGYMWANHVGGVVGKVLSVNNGNGAVQYCYATGTVSTANWHPSSDAGNNVGGIVGNLDKTNGIIYCAALGPAVKGKNEVGKAVGYISQSTYFTPIVFSEINVATDGLSLNSIDGSPKTADEIIGDGFFADILRFNTGVWNLEKGKLPTLKNVGGPQDGTVPAHILASATIANVFSNGNGTSGDPYKIGTPEELAALTSLVNAGNTSYNAAHYELTADIDLSGLGRDWVPIGTASDPFKGVIDGGGYKITGLYVNNPALDC
ncbi:MAG: hypothetical protein LBS24_03570, partial [Clostridiales Family XIII bacterium]|nr:hypothetical protein [Clostridiales Family XIII bacterium]